jgi:class 3 adenylate cyclase
MITPGTPKQQPSAPAVELASILFLDIVGYSLKPMDRQSSCITQLQQIVRGTEQFKAATARDALLSLPTGDGMAIVFFLDPVAPVQCAITIAQALKSNPDFALRIGVHSGPVYRHADIRDQLNVVGGGINIAQRVMDCGDAGHILVSQSVADVLRQLGGWTSLLHDMGECAVKHGTIVRLYNIYSDDTGNPATPAKLRAQRRPARQSILKSIAAYGLPPLILTFAVRMYFNTSSVTRESPFGAADTFVVFLVFLAVTAVILWLKRVVLKRFASSK